MNTEITQAGVLSWAHSAALGSRSRTSVLGLGGADRPGLKVGLRTPNFLRWEMEGKALQAREPVRPKPGDVKGYGMFWKQ